MQPTEESLKIATDIIRSDQKRVNSHSPWDRWQESISEVALALDAAYQRGRDQAVQPSGSPGELELSGNSGELRSQLDSALALAAQRGEALKKRHKPDCVCVYCEGVEAPETWLADKLKRARAEGAIAELERLAREFYTEGGKDVAATFMSATLHEEAAAIRKEAGL